MREFTHTGPLPSYLVCLLVAHVGVAATNKLDTALVELVKVVFKGGRHLSAAERTHAGDTRPGARRNKAPTALTGGVGDSKGLVAEEANILAVWRDMTNVGAMMSRGKRTVLGDALHQCGNQPYRMSTKNSSSSFSGLVSSYLRGGWERKRHAQVSADRCMIKAEPGL